MFIRIVLYMWRTHLKVLEVHR